MITGAMSDKMLGLVERRRERNSMLYAISDPMVSKLCALVWHSEAEKSHREFKELHGQAPGGGER